MIKRSLTEITAMCGGVLLQAHEDIEITGVTINSREVKENQLYVPIVGKRFDGHDFLEEAVKKGIGVTFWQKDKPLPKMNIPIILVEDTLQSLQMLAKSYRNQLSCKVIGVTGSNGKTSTKDILYQIFSQAYKTYKTQGNKNNEIGLPLTILECEEDVQYLILEMGMSAMGEISFLSKLAEPDIAIITSIGKAHLADLGGIENIIQAKMEILDGLNPAGKLYANGDCTELKQRLDCNYDVKEICYYGEGVQNDYQIKEIKQSMEGISFKVEKISNQPFLCSLIGHHQAFNATAAILVALDEGIDDAAIRNDLTAINAASNRLEVVPVKKSIILNDSYKSNPESLQAAITTLKNMPDDYCKIAVLADMKDLGEEAYESHVMISEQLDPKSISYLYTLGDLSDLFNYDHKYDENHYKHFDDKNSLLQEILGKLNGKNIILIKGANDFGLSELVEKLKEE